jgi:hypothetical protein
MAKFNAGDKVVWSHELGAIHATGSIIKQSVLADGDEFVGTVEGTANAEETHFNVTFKGGETRVLTGDELVRVAPEE